MFPFVGCPHCQDLDLLVVFGESVYRKCLFVCVPFEVKSRSFSGVFICCVVLFRAKAINSARLVPDLLYFVF